MTLQLTFGSSFRVGSAATSSPLAVGAPTTVGPRGAEGPEGPPGPPGPSATVSVTAQVDMQALTAVKVMQSNVARPARSTNMNDATAVAGVILNAALAGESVPIRTSGAINTTTPHGLPIGPIYLDVDGSLTSDPATGLFQLRLGYVFTTTLLVVRIDPPIVRA